jgi:hypothetical protein
MKSRQHPRFVPFRSVLASAPHVRDSQNPAAFEPRQGPWIKVGLHVYRICAISAEKRRMRSVERDSFLVDDRERNIRAVVARRLHLDRFQIVGIIMWPNWLDLRIGDPSGFRFESEDFRLLRPPCQPKVNPFEPGIASDQIDAAVKRELDWFRCSSRVGNPKKLANAAVQLLHIKSISHRGRALHHCITRRNDHSRVCYIGMRRTDLQDLRSRRTFVSRQKQIAALEADIGHFIR